MQLIKMEEKNSISVFKLLSASNLKINILETYILTYNRVEFGLFTNQNTATIKKISFPKIPHTTCIDLIGRILKSLEIRLKITGNTQEFTSLTNKFSSIFYDNEQLMDLYEKKPNLLDIEMIQRYPPDYKRYHLKLNFVNKEYKVEIFHKSKTHPKKAKKSNFTTSATDLARSIVSYIEEIEMKRTIYMELDLCTDRNGNTWLVSCNKYKSIEPKYCLIYNLTSLDKIEKLGNQIPKKVPKYQEATMNSVRNSNIQLNAKLIRKTNNVVFVDGHVRNADSNLGTPIKITSPESSIDDISLTEESNYFKKRHHTKELSILTSKTMCLDIKDFDDISRIESRKGQRQAKSGYSNEFMELMLKTHCRRNRISLEGLCTGESGFQQNISQEEFSRFFALDENEEKEIKLETSELITPNNHHKRAMNFRLNSLPRLLLPLQKKKTTEPDNSKISKISNKPSKKSLLHMKSISNRLSIKSDISPRHLKLPTQGKNPYLK